VYLLPLRLHLRLFLITLLLFRRTISVPCISNRWFLKVWKSWQPAPQRSNSYSRLGFLISYSYQRGGRVHNLQWGSQLHMHSIIGKPPESVTLLVRKRGMGVSILGMLYRHIWGFDSWGIITWALIGYIPFAIFPRGINHFEHPLNILGCRNSAALLFF